MVPIEDRLPDGRAATLTLRWHSESVTQRTWRTPPVCAALAE
jgi:hypothetical protein